MIQRFVGCCIGAGGAYFFTHGSSIWGIIVLIFAVGVMWGASRRKWFYIPIKGWFSTEGSSAGTGSDGSDGCGGGGGDGGD